MGGVGRPLFQGLDDHRLDLTRLDGLFDEPRPGAPRKISDGTSVQGLERDIRGWIVTWNENPRAYVWVKTADQILASNSAHQRA